VASHVARLRFEAGGSAECTVLAVEHQRASGMEITGTALGQMMQSTPRV
jgi:hypothetical protein